MNIEEKQQIWSSFQQTELLTTRINNILNDYPPGVTVLREFLQNADDAKASRFGICLDYRASFPVDNLLSDKLKQYYNVPSLLVYNNANFSEKDFLSLISIGNSGKRKDDSTIGRYGLGFNASFHLTDLVSFISGEDLVIIDPHGKSLPNNVLGLRSKWKDLEQNSEFKSTVIPFTDSAVKAFNSYDDNSILENGTVFRLPLRTAEQGKSSLLSSETTTLEEAYELLQNFAENAVETLLFLKNVQDISIRIILPNGNVEILHETSLTKCINLKSDIDSMLNPRHAIIEFLETNSKQLKKKTIQPDYRAKYILKFESCNINKELSHEEWLIYSGADTSAIACESAFRAEQVPWGGIAACIMPTARRVTGRAYSFLPLPITTGLPVHINAAFALSSDRRNLWTNNDIDKGNKTSKSSWKGAWNHYLLNELIPTLYSEVCGLLAALINSNIYAHGDSNNMKKQSIDFYNTIWPRSFTFYTVAHQMIKKVAKLPVFFTASTYKTNHKKKGQKIHSSRNNIQGSNKKDINSQQRSHWIELDKAIFVGEVMDKIFQESENIQFVEDFHLALARGDGDVLNKNRNNGGEQQMSFFLSVIPDFVKETLVNVIPDHVQTTNPYMISSLLTGVDLSASVVRILLRYFMSVKWFEDGLIDDENGDFIKVGTDSFERKELKSQCSEGPMCCKFLNGLKILPLRPSRRDKNKKSLRFGTFSYICDKQEKSDKPNKTKRRNNKHGNKDNLVSVNMNNNYFFVNDTKYYALAKESHRIICFESIPEIRRLLEVTLKMFDGSSSKYNVQQLTPQNLIHDIGLETILPKELKGYPIVAMCSDGQKDDNRLRTIDKLALSHCHDLTGVIGRDSTKYIDNSRTKYATKKMKKKKKKQAKKSNTKTIPRPSTNSTDNYSYLLPSEYKSHPNGQFTFSQLAATKCDVAKLMESIKLLWHFLSDATNNLQNIIAGNGFDLDIWPLIPVKSYENTSTIYFISYKYAKFRSLLLQTDKATCKNDQNSVVNHELFLKWGALYIDESSSCVTDALLDIFDIPKHSPPNSILERYISAIACGITENDISTRSKAAPVQGGYYHDCIKLRDEILRCYGVLNLTRIGNANDDALVLSIAKRAMGSRTRNLLKRLPIYLTLNGGEFVPLVAYNLDKNGYYPNYFITPGDGEWVGISKWDRLLESMYGKEILSLIHPKERYLLMITNNPRPELISFIASDFFHSRLNDNMPLNVCLELLKVVGSKKLAKRDNLKPLLNRLSETRIVVYEDGHRSRPCEVVDPADKLLVSILLKPNPVNRNVENDGHIDKLKILEVNNTYENDKIISALPPPLYLDDKDVMAALRSLGCASLVKFDSFLRVAKIVALENNINGGKQLCKFIVNRYQSLGWSVSQWNQLHSIKFIPAYKIQTSFLPYRSNTGFSSLPRKPTGKILRDLDRSFIKQRKSRINKNSKSSNRRHKYTRQSIEMLLEDETTSAIDYGDDGNIVGIEHLKNGSRPVVDITRVICKSLEWYDVNGRLGCDDSSCKIEMIPFFQPAAILRVDAMVCWTATAGILPSCFDRSPTGLLKHMGIKHVPRYGQVISHLLNLAPLWDKLVKEKKNLSKSMIKSMQACIMSSFAVLSSCSDTKNSLRSQFVHCKFIILNDGRIVSPKEICIDLDDHMGDLAMPVPCYLSDFSHLLREIGALSIESLQMPSVQVKGMWPLTSFQNNLSSIFNKHQLSDVRFAIKTNNVIRSNSSDIHFDGTFQYFYCHKLILGMASEAFMNFFSGGMSDSIVGTSIVSSSNGWNGTTILLDDWVDERSLELFLKYVYGEAKEDILDGLPVDEITTLYCINIMRLSDMYFLPHLKSIMECWLSSNDVIDVYNVVSLLTHASSCHAYQLLKRCVYIARQMYNIVSNTPEWYEFQTNYPEVVLKIEHIPKSSSIK